MIFKLGNVEFYLFARFDVSHLHTEIADEFGGRGFILRVPLKRATMPGGAKYVGFGLGWWIE